MVCVEKRLPTGMLLSTHVIEWLLIKTFYNLVVDVVVDVVDNDRSLFFVLCSSFLLPYLLFSENEESISGRT